MNNFNKVLGLGLLCCAGSMIAREIRNPLPVPMMGFSHYPIMYERDEQDQKNDKPCGCCRDYDDGCCELPVQVAIIGSVYERTADKAFGCKNGTCKVPLTNLIFGKSDFTIGESFPGGYPNGVLKTGNPFVAISTISPRYEYSERGAIFGACLETRFCNNKAHAGLRARIPVRDCEFKQTPTNESDLTGETLSDVFVVRQEQLTSDLGTNTITNAYAARLDFLAQLNIIAGGNAFVSWTPNLKLAGQTVTSPNPPDVLTDIPGIAVLGSTSGAVPFSNNNWANEVSAIDPTAVVAASGTGVGNGIRGYFLTGTDYSTGLALAPQYQRQLFVVPTVKVSTGASITQDANIILNTITASTEGLGVTSVNPFLEANGINIAYGRKKGLGDLDLDLVAGRLWGCNDCIFSEVLAGLRLPTGGKLCDCRRPLELPLGNGGHPELRLGATLGWDMCDTFKATVDGTYSFVLSATEKIPAPFIGATIKNIGPCVPARINWNHFELNAILSAFASRHCGLDVGYQFYWKGCDKICMCWPSATDLAGNTNQRLDPRVAQRLTNVISHKVRTEFFMSTSCCELFGGFLYAFAGKNAFRDTDAFVGIRVNF
ncbi:MAG: hypothetical protein UU47_C0002G0031 [candidate division TM6 bacterium GW2011_GWE2_41_16]|nr:MAG: hypothetical protein UU47_C0002G0031 [candidate division TM6 bacterium GW2011_GWE2_41_16]